MTLKNHEKTDHAYWFILAKLQPIEMQRKVAVVQRWFGARKCDVLTVGLWPTSANELQPTVNALDNAVPFQSMWPCGWSLSFAIALGTIMDAAGQYLLGGVSNVTIIQEHNLQMTTFE